MLLIKVFILSVLISFDAYAQGYVCAVGGGSENYNDWSDLPYGWMVEKADSDKIIVLSYSSSTWYNNYFTWLGAAECTNKVIASRSIAELQSTYDDIISAKGIFIVGGDQSKYIDYWLGTKTEDAVREVFLNGGVIAGTSAGAMILSEIVFSARNGSAYSKQSLLNPFYSRITLEDDFLNLVPEVIFDTHFIERGRFGRLIAFLINYYVQEGRLIMGLGIDDKTAVCIEPDGVASVYGTGAVSFFRFDDVTRVINNADGYMVENLRCDKLVQGWKYHLPNKEIYHIPATAKLVDTTRTWSYPLSDLTLTGRDQIESNLGTSLNEFLAATDPEFVCIITHSGYNISPLETYLFDNGYNFNSISLAAGSMNDPAVRDLIDNSSAYIFLGDDLVKLSSLNDASTLAGAAFNNKIAAGTPAYFMGNSGKISGDYFVDNVDTDPYAAYEGRMINLEGLGAFGDLIYQPRLFENDDFIENRVSSLTWGLMLNRKRIGVYSDIDNYLNINSIDKTISIKGTMPAVIIDARGTTYVDSSVYVVGGGVSTRQVAGMSNLRYNISKLDRTYSLPDAGFVSTTSVSEEIRAEKSGGDLRGYPNPFNNMTTVVFTATEPGYYKIQIYDILGSLTGTVADSYLNIGTHSFIFNPGDFRADLPSGIYFCSLYSNGKILGTIKLNLIK